MEHRGASPFSWPSWPYVHQGRVYKIFQQPLAHTNEDRSSGLADLGQEEVERNICNKIAQIRLASVTLQTQKKSSTPNIAGLSLDSDKERQTLLPSGKKRRVDFSRANAPKSQKPGSWPCDARLYNSDRGGKGNEDSAQSAADNPKVHSSAPKHKQPYQPQSNRQYGLIEPQMYDPRYPGLLLQPESRPISQEQLASEVKSIYAGLTMVETKCIHIDRAQAAAAPHHAAHKLAPDHWQALLALHRTLLHEHHDFFRAHQHPSAGPELRQLAARYAVPARMWKHGIYSYLELLRRERPNSSDYRLDFIYLAYQMMALLYKTVPAFKDTWVACLADLGRYRMAIEDEDTRDRETWTSVARVWYSKAADKNPKIGRLYHHLAILARPNALKQLLVYTNSLTCLEPSPNARQIITTLFDPMIERTPPESDISSWQHSLYQFDDHIDRCKVKLDGEENDPLNQMMLSEPSESDHSPTLTTHYYSQWLSNGLHKVLSLLLQVLSLFLGVLTCDSPRLHATPGSHTALAFWLLVPKASATSSTQPPPAGASTGSQPLSLGPLLIDRTPFDYVMYGIMAIYLAGACLAGPLARRYLGLDAAQRVRDMFKYCSLFLTAAMSFVWIALMGDELAAGIYISVVKIWAVTTLHFVIVDCSDAIHRTSHIITFLVLAILIEFIGIAMQQSASGSFLKALPPSLTVAAIFNWAVYLRSHRSSSTGVERHPLTDAEQGVQQPLVNSDDGPDDHRTAIPLNQRPARQQTGLINSGGQMRRRNSIHAAEGFDTTDIVGSGSDAMVTRVEASSHRQQSGTADRPDQSAHRQQDHREDTRFAIGDGFDDVSLHHQ